MDNKKKVRNLLLYLGIPILIILAVAMLYGSRQTETPKTSELVQYFEKDMVDSYTINYGSGAIELTLKEGETAFVSKNKENSTSPSQVAETTAPAATNPSDSSNSVKKAKQVVVKGQLADIQRFLNTVDPYIYDYHYQASGDEVIRTVRIPGNLVRASDNSLLMELIPTILLTVLFIGAWIFIMRKMSAGGLGGKEMNFGKAKIKNTNDEKRKTTFDDVAGADEEKEELAEVVEFLKAPDKYNKLGARIPKGVLLVGPPGTGKTLLARAVAG